MLLKKVENNLKTHEEGCKCAAKITQSSPWLKSVQVGDGMKDSGNSSNAKDIDADGDAWIDEHIEESDNLKFILDKKE